MKCLKQFGLLLWKNYVIQKRKVVVTIIEIGLPTFFALILILIRQRVKGTDIKHPTTWDPFPVSELPGDLYPSPFCKLFKSKPSSCKWKIYYAPNMTAESDVMGRVKDRMTRGDPSIKEVVGFETEEALVAQFTKDYALTFCDTLAGVVFVNLTEKSSISSNHTDSTKHIKYKIRLPYTPRHSEGSFSFATMGQDENWQTEAMFPQFQTVGPRDKNNTFGADPAYFQEGFLTLQLHIDRAILHQVAPSAHDLELDTELRRFPYPRYKDDLFVLVLQTQFPFIIMISFVFSALQIVKDVVHEKERKLKESMKMMGLSNWLHWTAWFVKYYVFLLISVSIMTVLFCINVGSYGSVIGNTDWSVLLVFLVIYAVSTINFAFMVSVFFSKANSGAAAGGILFFLSYVPYTFLQKRYNTLTLSAKVSSCLISNVAMSMGAQVISMFEGTGAGVQWSTINQGASVDDDFTLAWVMGMLLVDSVLYALIAWYVEAVWPGEYGIPQPWYFPFLKVYWCGSSPDVDDPERVPLLSRQQSKHNEFIESDPQGLKAGIKISNLRKVFRTEGKDVVAVDGMTLNMYEGQITALLGHNGAGKTTTMSMLTGFFPATSGTARVNGWDIRSDITKVRESLGLCPQHNVLFDSLTVQEHLEFFAKLKGCESKDVADEITKLLKLMKLESKRHTQTKQLSGGMKRKLSVGIALIGGSKVVILDEPTSGMDPDARRQMWDILQQHRRGRTMVLTTHYMDEADVLGDRIAIMASGLIQCSGTPLFLKNKYGAGYHMVMVKKPGCDVDKVTAVIEKHVPTACLESNVSAELSFVLPHESKSMFVGLFEEIEKRKDELNIASYGASVTTMEEVFLKVGEIDSPSDSPSSVSGSTSNLSEADNTVLLIHSLKNCGVRLYWQQFLAMFVKRVLHTWRNRLVTFTQLLVPLFFAVLALIVIRTLPHPEDSPPLTLNLSDFGRNYVPYGDHAGASAFTEGVLDKYSHQFAGQETRPLHVNLTNTTMQKYLVAIGRNQIATYNMEYMIALEMKDGVDNSRASKTTATTFFNAQAYHTAPMTLNALDNSLLEFYTNKSHTVSTVNHPFPRTVANKINGQLTQEFEGFALAVNIVFGMAFLASSFVLFLIKERSVKAKHCQFVSGVRSSTFWSATFAWDIINYSIPCVLLIVAFAAFNVKPYVDDNRFLDIMLLFMLHGWAILPFMYLLSFLFTVPASGFVWLSMLNLILGIATVLAVDILRIPGLNTMDVAKTLEWIFLTILPNFCLGQGLSDFYSNHQFLEICTNPMVQAMCQGLSNQTNPCCKGKCGKECIDYTENYLSFEPGGIGRMLVFLAVQGAMYFILLFFVESHAFQWLWYKMRPHSRRKYAAQSDALVQEDSDVASERDRIFQNTSTVLAGSESLVLSELTKYYGGLLAVDRLSLGIVQGECFGLLGINGAGKTTTFKMLTGDEIVSSGEAYLNGFSIRTDIQQVRRQLGYCPQFDALIDQLTGRETLTMYARVRGIPERNIHHSVQALIERLHLDKYADNLVHTYSGGNKRKLSTAVSLIGDPPIVFLDEPSTGMDPVARRQLWDTLSEIRASGSTLVLTSHSMEECEALCTKLAIMVNGQIKCLGSTQKLKSKYGEGYTLIAKVSPSRQSGELDPRPLMEHIEKTFPASSLKDVHQGMVHYHIADPAVSWAELFRFMEQAKEDFHLEDYSVSQTTLEQVFLNFARSQVPPQETAAGRCHHCCNLCRLCMCGSVCCHGQRSEHRLLSVTTENESDSDVI